VPRTNDLELPIRPLESKRGPAVDARNNRKEENNNTPATTAEFRANYQALKAEVFGNLQSLIEDAPRR
jgi:hypothetical protein